MSTSAWVRRPPLWLAAAAVAAGWGAVYSIGRWIVLFALGPVHEDVRFTYVAAQAGLRYGWSTIYDPATLRSLSISFPLGERDIGSHSTYINPPLLAWLFAPLTAVPEPMAYALWTALSLGALVWAWHLAAPYTGLARITLLLLALALWPVLLAFYSGQPSIVLFLLVTLAWWLSEHERPLAAGAALALATFLKPQAVALIPLAILVSGRYKPVVGWVLSCAVLGLASIVTLGPSGLIGWWHALQDVQADPSHASNTLTRVFGLGPLTYALWALQGTAALFVAWWRKRELELVFAAGILGSAAVAFHFHEWDYTLLVLAVWLVLRTSPALWHRLWLVAGVLPMQLMTYGPAAAGLALIAPQLVWDATWLGILAAGGLRASTRRTLATAPPPATESRSVNQPAVSPLDK
ncbi:MAG: glycosyltransferase family 87 protein [Candidatus Dormibacteraceae bacterium]